MATKLKRPTSVWVAQVLLFVFALIFIAPLFATVPALFNRSPETPLVNVLLVVVANAAIVGLFAAAFWGMVRGRAYGRWLGAAMLFAALVMVAVGQIFRPGDTDGPRSGAPSAGTIGAEVLIAVLFLLLIYNLVFSKQAAAFFSAPSGE